MHDRLFRLEHGTSRLLNTRPRDWTCTTTANLASSRAELASAVHYPRLTCASACSRPCLASVPSRDDVSAERLENLRTSHSDHPASSHPCTLQRHSCAADYRLHFVAIHHCPSFSAACIRLTVHRYTSPCTATSPRPAPLCQGCRHPRAGSQTMASLDHVVP